MDSIGRYEVVERIGIGGMGEVFRCRASGVEGFRKDVVVKVVLPEMQGEPEFERAFVDEAKLSVQLQHPNIVQTLDLGKHEERLYLVMEFVDGHDLGFLLRALRRQGKRVPMPLAVYTGIELLRGLDYAHKARGPDGAPMEIVHRDVTPGNVMLSFAGAVKLADFGIARFTSRSQQKTTTGFVKGKVAYMPPEQVESRPLGPATDVFSAALVISTMMLGKHPLEAASEAELIDRIRSGDIPLPGKEVEGVPRALDRILQKALEPRLEKRTQTALALIEELEAFVLDNHVRTGPGHMSAFMLEVFHEELARRAKVKGSAELVTANVPPPAVATVTPSEPLGPRPDVNVPATRSVPATSAAPASRGRRVLVLAPAALLVAGGATVGGWFGREQMLLGALRGECEGEWQVLAMRPVDGGPPGGPLAKGEDRRLVLARSAEGGLRLSFRTKDDETLSIPLDLEREGATLTGRYNGIPVKFWPGGDVDFGKAVRMNVNLKLRPLGAILEVEASMFGEGLGNREWQITAERKDPALAP